MQGNVEVSGLKEVSVISEVFKKANFQPANIIVHKRNLVGDYNRLARFMKTVLQLKNDNVTIVTVDTLKYLKIHERHHPEFKENATTLQQVYDDVLLLGDNTESSVLRVKSGDVYANNTVSEFHPDGLSRILVPYNDPVPLWVANSDAELDEEIYGVCEEPSYKLKPDAVKYKMTAGNIWHFAGMQSSLAVDPLLHQGVSAANNNEPLLVAVAEPMI